MARIEQLGNVGSQPTWIGDFLSREHIVPFPAKVDASQFSDGNGVLVKANGAASAGTDEVQLVTVDATGGTFTLTFGGQTTGAIAYNASASDVENALEALSSIGEGNVKVSGSAGGPYTVTFINDLGKQNVAQLTANSASLTGNTHTATPSTTTPGVAGATSITVDALKRKVRAGTVLNFGSNKFAVVSAEAAAGATSVSVNSLTKDIADNDEAIYSPYGTKTIKSGTLVGRTYAERDANTPFGPADDTDDEIYLTVFDIVDANVNNDVELYRHGGLVKENYLPDYTTISGDANLLVALRSNYTCIKGVN